MRRKKWRRSIGKRPNRVTVFEREPGGLIYRQVWDPSLRGGRGNFRRSSLGHRDKDRATTEAAEFHAKLLKGADECRSGPTRLARLFALYTEHRLGQDEFRVEMLGNQRSYMRQVPEDAPKPMVADFFSRADDRPNHYVYVKGSSVLHSTLDAPGSQAVMRLEEEARAPPTSSKRALAASARTFSMLPMARTDMTLLAEPPS